MAVMKNLEEIVLDVIIADRTIGVPTLPEGRRDEVIDALRRMLVNRDRLAEYIRMLQDPRKLGTDFRDHDPLPEDLGEKAVLTGVDALDDGTLALLLLNPVALCALADEIDERMPAAWFDAMAEDGRALLREEGMPATPAWLEDLVSGRNKKRPGVVAGALDAADSSGGAAPPVERPTQTWRWDKPGREWTWTSGAPASFADGEGTIAAEWYGDRLEVAVEGFLRTGIGYTIEAEWRNASGAVVAAGTVTDQLAAAVRIAHDTAPQAGDTLLVRHTWRPREGEGWQVEATVTFTP